MTLFTTYRLSNFYGNFTKCVQSLLSLPGIDVNKGEIGFRPLNQAFHGNHWDIVQASHAFDFM
jgi:hypothetical protein